MELRFESEAERQAWETVQRINAAWTGAGPDRLDDLLHPRMVIVPPGFAAPVRGRGRCASSYRDFAARAAIEEFRIEEARVECLGDTTVVSYAFDLTYVMGGTRYRDQGHDLYVLTRQEGQWLAAWRTLVLKPAT
jgi:ketosteroid isomerase-like protein